MIIPEFVMGSIKCDKINCEHYSEGEVILLAMGCQGASPSNCINPKFKNCLVYIKMREEFMDKQKEKQNG
jgi:hypothetical protein